MNIPNKKRIASIILKCIVFFSAVTGTYLSAVTETGGFMNGGKIFMYFTIQSNIFVALISAIGFVLLLRRQKICSAWHVIKYVGAVSITLTGVVFSFVLAPTLGDKAWTLRNILTHVIVPIAFIIDFFVIAVYGDLQKRHIPFVLIPPGAYAVYAGIGYLAGWEFRKGVNYPYFFLNWGSPAGAFGFSSELPFMGTAWWILALVIFLLIFGAAYLWIVNRLKRRRLDV